MTTELLGRAAERTRLDDLLEPWGRSVQVVGPPRSGRTSLLHHWVTGIDATVVRLAGVADEAGLPGAGLDRLLRSLGAPAAPGPREALASAGPARVLCLVDDADRVDAPTLAALTAAAGGRVAVVLTSAGDPRLAGLPALALGPLRTADARRLLVRLAPDLDPVVAARLVDRTDRCPGTVVALAEEVRRRGPCAPELLTDGPIGLAGLRPPRPGPLLDAARAARATRLTTRPADAVGTLLAAAEQADRAGATRLAAGWLGELDPTTLDDHGRLRVLALRVGSDPDELLGALESGHAAGDTRLGRAVAARALTGPPASYGPVAERLHRLAGSWDDGTPGAVLLRGQVAVGALSLAEALPVARAALRVADEPVLAAACWERPGDAPGGDLHGHLARGDHDAAYALAVAGLSAAPPALRGPQLPDAIEAALGSGRDDVADRLLAELAEVAATVDRPWARGVLARCRALRDPGAAPDLLDVAIAELADAGARVDLARAHLLAGEWLRRRRMRGEATAHLVQAAAGLRGHPLGERARRELGVLRSAASRDGVGLTHQERVVARLAASGRSNLDIGRRLAISRHTVDHHLRQVYRKLDVAGRHQLGALLAPGAGQ